MVTLRRQESTQKNTVTATDRRPQWGSDTRALPATPLVPRVSDARVAVGRAFVVGTVVAWIAYLMSWLSDQFINGAHHTARGRVEAVCYLGTVTFLTASALAYLTCRLGFFYRARDHRRLARAALEQSFTEKSPSITVLVPSYKEDLRIIRATLLSAALQDYPDLRVVLLIDDPIQPTRKSDRRLLEQARELAPQLQELLHEPGQRFTRAWHAFAARTGAAPVSVSDMTEAGEQYDAAADWLTALADDTEIVDHADVFFVDQVLRAVATDFRRTAQALRGAAEDGLLLPDTRLLELYRRLAWTFSVELSCFERKQYVSLSHEANKAMNLNSYIGLMGGAYRDMMTVSGRELVPAGADLGGWEVPDPDYVLTLDADSILLPEYCLRLVHLMEQSEHADVAVAQTPYCAIPGSSTRLERIAGATTDLQYIAHQGMTYYRATFWVGANAVLRKRALDDVRESTFVGSWEIRRYIQNRTVIEDTESTIDLRAKGWSLLNYPERLAYSATPPDFGSLCIQRRRWANGGLLIMPKLWRTRRARTARGEYNTISENFIRANYMASVAWSSASLLLLLAYPFNNQLISPLLGLIALPYFIGMASDLKYCGYKRTDILRVYGLNLILMPVNLAGVCNSLVQSLTGEKSVFSRTPKVANRTAPDFIFVMSPFLLVGLAGWTLYRDWTHNHWVNFCYAFVNTALALYAIVAFMGMRQSVGDLFRHAKGWLSVPAETQRTVKTTAPAATITTDTKPDWLSILHFGDVDSTAHAKSGANVPALQAQRSHPSARGRVFAQTASSEDEPRFRTDFEPIVALVSGRIAGREAHTRFEEGAGVPQQRTSDVSGSPLELEILLARASVRAAASFAGDGWLGLNVSLELVRAGRALHVTVMRARRTIVLQLDARSLIGLSGMGSLVGELPPGTALALTAVTPDEQFLTLIERLRPAFIKLDRTYVHGIHDNSEHLAQVCLMAQLAERIGAGLIAESIDSKAELVALREAGVGFGQGYVLGVVEESPKLLST